MAIGKICKRKVVYVSRKTNALEAAKFMRKYHVGDLIVVEDYVDDESDEAIPVGIVTDRDLVVEVMAHGLSPKDLRVEDIMARNLVTVRADAEIYDAVLLMRRHGVRRLPVVRDNGTLIGIVALDDLMSLLAGEMKALTRVVPQERVVEASLRP